MINNTPNLKIKRKHEKKNASILRISANLSRTHHHCYIRKNVAVFAYQRAQVSNGKRNVLTYCGLSFFFYGYNSIAFSIHFFFSNSFQSIKNDFIFRKFVCEFDVCVCVCKNKPTKNNNATQNIQNQKTRHMNTETCKNENKNIKIKTNTKL